MMSKNVRVLQLVSTMGTGGIEKWLMSIMPYLYKKKVKVDFLCRRLPPKSIIKQLEKFDSKVWVSKSDNIFLYTIELWRILKENNYSLANNHLSIHSGLPALLLSLMRVKSLVSFHNSYFEPMIVGNYLQKKLNSIYGGWSLNNSVKTAEVVTFGSEDILLGISKIVKVDAKKANVIYYGVDIPQKATDTERLLFKKKYGIDENSHIVLNIGRFNKQKNHFGLIEIANQILVKFPNTVFLLVGDGPILELAKNRVAELSIEKNFLFVGKKQNISDFYRCSDLFLFPSLWEGLPIAALEAAAAGLPIVGSNVAGIKTIVDDKNTGRLIELDDLTGFSEAVIEILNNKSLKQRMSEKSINRIKEYFSREASSKSIYALFEKVSMGRKI